MLPRNQFLRDTTGQSISSRRLATETYVPDPANPTTPETLAYTFDPDNLGVRVKAENATESVVLHEADPTAGGLDAFFRLADEDRFSEFHDFLASGDNTGPGHFWLWLGEGATPAEWDLVDRIYPDPDLGDGNWQAPLALKDESYSLKATAEHLHPDSTFAPEDTVSFTVAAGGDAKVIANTYDNTGRLVARSWASGEVTQILTWDATGKLLRVTQTDNRANRKLENFTWTAMYDPAGRRIETTYVPDNAPLAGAEAARAIRSWYDPQVEFLEIAVETSGKRWWKFHGPDLDGGYGQFQGVGGLEVVVEEATGEVVPVIDDLFGTIVARIDLGDFADPADDEVIWTKVQTSGYGPLPGSRMRPLEKVRDLPAVLAWQGRRIDPTGLFHMGARYYDPGSGSFLSTDPLGHRECPDLYSYANGDPINFIDPTGRGPVGDPVLTMNPLGPNMLQAINTSEVKGLRAARFDANGKRIDLSQAEAMFLFETITRDLNRSFLASADRRLTSIVDAGMPDPADPGGYVNLALASSIEFVMARLMLGPKMTPTPRPISGPSGVGLPKNSNSLVHLTDARHGLRINQSGVLRGDTYVGPLSNAHFSGIGVTARTGLSGTSFQAGVRIPAAGEAAFSRVTPIGPITGWQRLTGQQYTSRGVLDLQTGAFQRTGVNWNQATIYGVDAGISAGGATAIGLGLFLYGND